MTTETTEATNHPNTPDSPDTRETVGTADVPEAAGTQDAPGALDVSEVSETLGTPLETIGELGSTEPPEPQRDWMSVVPENWNDWSSLRKEVSASPASQQSFRNWMMNHLDEGQHLERGLGLAAAGEFSTALEHLQAADGDLASLLTARCLSTDGDAAAAVQLLSSLTGSSAVGVRACLHLAELHLQSRDHEALDADGAALAAAGGSTADNLYVEGVSAEARGDHKTALDTWQRALEADGDHIETIFLLAELLDRYGDDDAALELLDRFRSGELPAHTGALMNLGVLYEDRDLYSWAATCFRMVVDAEPANISARRCLLDAEAGMVQFHDESQERKADKQNAVLRIPVTDFELSVRARNCLQRMNLHTLGDLVSRTESELLSFKNFGETSLDEVKEILAMKGLRLGMITGVVEEPEAGLVPATPSSTSSGDIRDMNVSELDLSVRSRAALATLGVTRVDDLCKTTETTLLSCKNFGQTSLDEIKSKLRTFGLELVG